MATDNSHFFEKLSLRLSYIKTGKEKILELFAGESIIWDEIKKTYPNLIIHRIEKEKGKNNKIHINADNMKILPSLNLDKYDIIDVDSYGVPYKQLEEIFKKEYNGIIIVTWIASIMGQMPKKLLLNLGYTKGMFKKCPILLSKNSIVILSKYLYIKEIGKVNGYFLDRKFYFAIDTREGDVKNVSNL